MALVTKLKFLKNFWEDWKVILRENHVIKKFELSDFTPFMIGPKQRRRKRRTCLQR